MQINPSLRDSEPFSLLIYLVRLQIAAHHRNDQAAKPFAATPKMTSVARGRMISANPPPKLISWWSAWRAQPVGRHSAMVWRMGGPISVGHQQPPRAPMSNAIITHRPATLSSLWMSEPIRTPNDAPTQA